jgi:uncharacterized protein YqgV (UPF0045/DUF77 family)
MIQNDGAGQLDKAATEIDRLLKALQEVHQLVHQVGPYERIVHKIKIVVDKALTRV